MTTDRPRGYHPFMNRRFRSLAALLALVGFTAFFAENLVAMSCTAPEAGAEATMHADAHHPAPASGDSEPDTPAPQDCPLVMAGGSCLMAVTLPAGSSPVKVPESAGPANAISVNDAADELVIRTLFHPPKS